MLLLWAWCSISVFFFLTYFSLMNQDSTELFLLIYVCQELGNFLYFLKCISFNRFNNHLKNRQIYTCSRQVLEYRLVVLYKQEGTFVRFVMCALCLTAKGSIVGFVFGKGRGLISVWELWFSDMIQVYCSYHGAHQKSNQEDNVAASHILRN